MLTRAAVRDLVRRVWYQSAEDNVPFLAGGLAFNILLALVPFVLLLMAGLSLFLGSEPGEAAAALTGLLERLLPQGDAGSRALLAAVLGDVVGTRGAVTVYSAIGFAWFSTRLFGSLRSVLAMVFDGTDRSIVSGKLFDLLATAVATAAVAIYVAVTTYLGLATTRGVALLRAAGLREAALGGLGYLVGRLLAVGLVVGLFYALYRGLPRRRPSRQVALVGAVTASLLFEIARHLFTLLLRHLTPESLYTGTIAAIVAVVFWTYYGAFLFLLGGEVAQAWELRRAELAALAASVPGEITPVPPI